MDTKQLKAKILDLAIHGKLLPLGTLAGLKNSPDYEPASKLLEKLRAEKEEKIAKGELKRDKKDSYIFIGDDNRHYEKFSDGSVKDIEDEIPFEAPEGWAWCRLGEISSKLKRGKSPKYTEKSSIMAFAQKCNQKDGPTTLEKALYIDESTLRKYPEEEKMQFNDIVINSTGTGTLGRVGIFDCNIPDDIVAVYPDSHVSSIRINPELFAKYFYYFVKSKQSYLETMGEGSTNQKELKIDTIANLTVSLPPISEQKLIVAEIEKIFNLIDSIETYKSALQLAVKRAKAKILDLAIHGKLVPQAPADEPAAALLEKLRAEKEAKIAKGELKRDKNDSYIYKSTTDNCHYEKFSGKEAVCIEEEIPFEIPDSWQWTKLGRICTKLVDGDHNPPKGIEEKTDYIMASSRNINHDCVEDLKNVRYLTKEMFEIENQRTKAEKGDIFFTSVGTLGRSCIYDGNLNICFQRSVSILKTQIENKYLKYFFDSSFYQDYVLEHATGTAQQGFYLQEMSESYIAIPPISEQKRIVSKIEELFEALDQIQSNFV